MFKELIHIFRTYYITFRYLKKSNINFLKNLSYTLIAYYLIINFQ
nr:Chain CD, SDHD [Tetrahymena thermophila]8BQS_CD Chain CD, succinate dehydrogenase complex iron-sulfur subunit D [Tetrahymena thermophila SB210]